MNWVLLAELAYILLIIGVCLRIVFDTRSTSKASAYILLVLLIPVVGIFIYFSVGVNYRKKKLYTKNLFADELKTEVVDYIRQNRDCIFTTYSTRIGKYTGLIDLMLNQNYSPLTDDNEIRLLINGEEKFPAVFEAIKKPGIIFIWNIIFSMLIILAPSSLICSSKRWQKVYRYVLFLMTSDRASCGGTWSGCAVQA